LAEIYKKDVVALYVLPVFLFVSGVVCAIVGVYMKNVIIILGGFMACVCAVLGKRSAKKAEQHRWRLLATLHKDEE